MELDHIFVCCDVGAPEAEVLIALGLEEGSPNTHPGQGTACRRFFFENAYLELLWVDDPENARAPAVAPTRLWQRWAARTIDACPFGIILRPGRPRRNEAPPWPTWAYRPAYLPDGLAILFAEETPISEPEWIWLPFLRERARAGLEPCAPRSLRSVTCSVASLDMLSPAAIALQSAGLVYFEQGDTPCVRCTFEGHASTSIDLRHRLPLILEW